MTAGFHSGLISLSELKLEYMKAHRRAYGERMTEALKQQLERELSNVRERFVYFLRTRLMIAFLSFQIAQRLPLKILEG